MVRDFDVDKITQIPSTRFLSNCYSAIRLLSDNIFPVLDSGMVVVRQLLLSR